LDVKKDIKLRVYIAFTSICLLGAAIIVKAAMIQMKEGPALRMAARELRTRTTAIIAERGSIYTEDGVLLTSSVPQFDVHIDFSVIPAKLFVKKVDSLALGLSRMFKDETPQQYKQELMDAFKSKDRYYALKVNLSYSQYQQIKALPVFRLSRNTGGFIEDSKEKRLNPYGLLAYRTIGLWRENSQPIGLEASYDTILKGVNGSRLEEKLSGNTWMPVDGSEVEAQDGKDLVTTLDISVQDVAEHAMKSVLQQYECAYGTCIVMEVKTGKIRALVNLGRQKDGTYWEDLNYALLPTEPGSTFKLATLISLLNNKCVTINDIIDAEGGTVQFGDRIMHDSHLGLGQMPVWKAYAKSSNVAFAKLADKYFGNKPDKFIASLKNLHLDQMTGIDLSGERHPFIKKPGDRNWSRTTIPWMATGYEIMVSPMQTCMLYNALANGGKMMKPYLVSGIKEYGKEVKVISPKVLNEHIADENVIKQLQTCTRAVITEGTGKGIESPFYTISGKTGTAQVADKGIAYTDGVYQGSFVGYFPGDKPVYTICVVIRTKPHSDEYYGGTIAAPVFRMVSDKIFTSQIGSWEGQLDSTVEKGDNRALLAKATIFHSKNLLTAINKGGNIASSHPGNMEQLSIDSNKRMSLKPQTVYRGMVPDVTGMALQDAVYLLENQGLAVQILGKGKVQKQSLTPGTKIYRGQNIILQLS